MNPIELEEKAKAGDIEAIFYYAGQLLTDCLGRQNEGIGWLEQAAHKGSGEAAFELGVIFDKGKFKFLSSPRDAAEWYRKGAVLGHSECQFSLGNLCAENPELGKTATEGAYWYLRAARKGNAKAQNNLAGLYKRGESGLSKDPAKAAFWYSKAAAQSDGMALYNYGECLFEGFGVKADQKKALEMFAKAVRLGNDSAKARMAQLHVPMPPEPSLIEQIPPKILEKAMRKWVIETSFGAGPSYCLGKVNKYSPPIHLSDAIKWMDKYNHVMRAGCILFEDKTALWFRSDVFDHYQDKPLSEPPRPGLTIETSGGQKVLVTPNIDFDKPPTE